MLLDLTVFKAETLDIKMAEDSVLHIPKPTERMAIEVIKLGDIDETKPVEALMAMNALVVEILNTNEDGLRFSADDAKKLTVAAKTAIVNAYAEFTAKVQSDPS